MLRRQVHISSHDLTTLSVTSLFDRRGTLLGDLRDIALCHVRAALAGAWNAQGCVSLGRPNLRGDQVAGCEGE